ncbi:asparagine synthase-related protein [Nesterenkonia alkaliphila]|nr:asparagine synthase-related protein [Nesterenkonia alkaliphila]GFZ96679.1 hypothetical protein GCM10011359_27650 [Nesterenkonia alkaliphila]
MSVKPLPPTAVCGVLGRMTEAHRQRADQMAELAEAEGVSWAPSYLLPGLSLRVNAAAVVQRGERHLAGAWNAGGRLAASLLEQEWPAAARQADACGIRAAARGTGVVHGSVSGCQVLYVHITGGAVFFSTRLRWLAETAGTLSPDWQAWTEIISFGAPLAGRTTFTEIRRLGPMEYVEAEASGTVQLKQQHWPWEDYAPQARTDIDAATQDTVEAMAALMRPHLHSPANPMLSGGRDSRMLTALARREAADPGALTAWSTSSDAGSALEELVAAQVAAELGLQHRIITGRYSQFGQDFAEYADAVDHQSSLHFWLMPVARQLRSSPGAVFDGIGGGVLLGGGFADPRHAERMNTQELLSARIQARARYLTEAERVFSPGAAAALRRRAQAGALPLAEQYLGHPNAHTLTSYLIRTAPSVAPAPAKVLGGAQPAVMPMVSDQVAQIALSLPHEAKAEGAWYPALLAAADPRLRGMPTADDLTGTRHHKRRIAGREAARELAGLIRGGPAADLLSEGLRAADPAEPQGVITWQRLLSTQRPQHLIRGLAMLTLWLQDYAEQLTDTEVRSISHA